MPEYLRSLLLDSPFSEVELLLAGLALAGSIALLATCCRPLSRWREERLLRRFVRRLGARRLSKLQLADGTGGTVTIDHVLLCRDSVCVVSVKRFHGLIFGGPKMDQWTQVIRRVSYKFPNPDDYLHRQVNAIQALLPDTPVHGIHLFTHLAHFPKDQPANVLSTRELRQLPKRPRLKDIPADLRKAWETLQAQLKNA
jgi:hypothetical protein